MNIKTMEHMMRHFFSKATFSSSSTVSTASIPIPSSITLYQYHICPFCSKAKVFLSYAGLSYQSVEVNPLTKRELKPWSGSYRKVPIAVIDGKQINGSDEILSALLKKDFVQETLQKKWMSSGMTLSCFTGGGTSSSTPNTDTVTPTRTDAAMTAAADDDDDAAIHNVQYWTTEYANDLAAILYPNIAATWASSHDMFRYVDTTKNSFSYWDKFLIRNIGSLAMTIAASKIKKKRGIIHEREALQETLLKWERQGLQNGQVPFSSGIKDQPNMADLNIFAILHTCHGLAVHQDLILNKNQPLTQWYRRMEEQCL